MRRLSKKKALSLVKELDAFPKIPESYVETTATGGTGAYYSRYFVIITELYATALSSIQFAFILND